MDVEIYLEEIRNKVYEISADTQLLKQGQANMKEDVDEHKAEMHEAKKEIDSLKADVNRAKGGIKFIGVFLGLVITTLSILGALSQLVD